MKISTLLFWALTMASGFATGHTYGKVGHALEFEMLLVITLALLALTIGSILTKKL